MNLTSLIDPPSAAIVIGGTLLATLLQCGRADSMAALAAIARLARGSRFDAATVRSGLAAHVTAIRRDGILSVEPPRVGDAPFDEATAAMIGRRSAAALLAAHEANRAQRVERDTRATRALVHAAELAPVFGLAGTLLSLSQLAPTGIAAAVLPQAIGMAVLTTLYGLVLANLVLAPLARAVDRAAETEERARQAVIDWLAAQLADVLAPAPAAVLPPRPPRAARVSGRAAA